MSNAVNRHSHITIILLSVLVGAALAAVALYYPRAQAPVVAQDSPQPSTAAQALEDTFVSVASRTLPTVVKISVVTRGTSGNVGEFDEFFKDMPFFEPFFRDRKGQTPRPRKGMSLGSGWVYSDDGYIVTNSHVVKDAEEISVNLYDKKNDVKQYPAKLVGTDPKTEIAVIKIDAGRKLPTLTLGDSKSVKVGQWAMAVGAPFQLEQTVTVGVISAKGRILDQSDVIRLGDIIQTDASINPGNSGGPLVNLKGDVIGINVAIVSNNRMVPGNVGIGFAIASETAQRVVPELIQHKKVARGWLGVSITELDENDRDFWGVENGGVIVEDITKDGPASKSELQVQDIITAVDGMPVTTTWELQKAIATTKPGATVTADVIRERKTLKIDITLGEMPTKFAGLEKQSELEKIEEPSVLGVVVEPLTEELVQQLDPPVETGVIVSGVEPNGPALAKLRRGDVITKINNSPVRSMAEYKKALQAAKKSGKDYVMVFFARKADEDWLRSHVAIEPEW